MESLAQTDINNIYLAIGVFVVTYIGSIIGGFFFILKMTWKTAQQKSAYDYAIKTIEKDIKELNDIKSKNEILIDNFKKDLNAAHEKIRKLENGL